MAVAKESKDNYNYNEKLTSTLTRAGFYGITRMANTLQGSIWRAFQSSNKQPIVIKVTNKYLHKHSITIANEKSYVVKEDVLMEASILKYLSLQPKIPKSIIKYHNLLESNLDYYLIMEDGGLPLFDFVNKAHKFIENGLITISEWHSISKVIFSSMIQSIEWLHECNVCHFDISLENFLINDVPVQRKENIENKEVQIKFIHDDIQLKLCDFGLAELFKDGNFKSSKHCGKRAYRCPEIVNKKRGFNAKENDIWCLGVCLFMLIIGSAPWDIASKSDPRFVLVMNGKLKNMLKHWNRSHYVTKQILNLLELFFKYESDRISLKDIKRHPWLL